MCDFLFFLLLRQKLKLDTEFAMLIFLVSLKHVLFLRDPYIFYLWGIRIPYKIFYCYSTEVVAPNPNLVIVVVAMWLSLHPSARGSSSDDVIVLFAVAPCPISGQLIMSAQNLLSEHFLYLQNNENRTAAEQVIFKSWCDLSCSLNVNSIRELVIRTPYMRFSIISHPVHLESTYKNERREHAIYVNTNWHLEGKHLAVYLLTYFTKTLYTYYSNLPLSSNRKSFKIFATNFNYCFNHCSFYALPSRQQLCTLRLWEIIISRQAVVTMRSRWLRHRCRRRHH